MNLAAHTKHVSLDIICGYSLGCARNIAEIFDLRNYGVVKVVTKLHCVLNAVWNLICII